MFGYHLQIILKCNYVTPKVELNCCLETSIQTWNFLYLKLKEEKLEFETTLFVSNYSTTILKKMQLKIFKLQVANL